MKTILSVLILAALTMPLQAGKVAESLGGKLVALDGKEVKPDADALEGKSVIAIYYSAHWCPPCRAFTPELAEFYKSAAKKYPKFQLIFVSRDKNADAMKEYMEWGKMEFPALQFGEKNPLVQSLSANGIPYLVVVDADGNQLAGKAAGEDWKNPSETLDELKKILKEKGGA
jgi:nucleoredoxin